MKFVLRTVAVSVAALMMALVFGVNAAHAATSTWTGEGSDTNFSTSANWDVAPAMDGSDDLVFPTSATGSHLPNNDAIDVTFASLTFTGNYNVENYNLSGNSFTLTGGISTSGSSGSYISAPIIISGNQTFTVGTSGGHLEISSVMSGSGNITKAGPGSMSLSGVNTFTGSFTISTGSVSVMDKSGLGTNAGGTIIEDGAYLSLFVDEADKSTTIAEPFTLNGLNSYDNELIAIGAFCGYDACSDSDITLSGAITLGADTSIESLGTVRLTGAITGSYHIDVQPGGYITLIVNSSSNGSLTPNGTYVAPPETTTYSANAPSTTIVMNKYQTGVLAGGTYQYASVGNLGVLKGSGTIVNSIYVNSGGIIAPGNSPGCITAGTFLSIYGEYQAELAGTTACNGYDQLSASSGVTLAGTLSLSLLDNYVPKQGDVFTIIDNKSADQVDGTFTDLAEGATFQVGSVVFRISYVGGDGNDVTVTAMTVPALPKTGFAKLTDVFALKLAVGFQRSPLLCWVHYISQRHHAADKFGALMNGA